MIAVDTVRVIPIASLEAHPDNPRIIVKEEVLSALVESIKSRGFDAAYALLVRPLEGKYQIVSGHTRRMAAEQAGIAEVPCWVREMSDEEAFLELVRANNQGELAPIEIGMHALRAVKPGEGGRGKKGGLSAYAESIGRSENTIRPYRDAARVYQNLTDVRDVSELLRKANHLAAVSRAPEADWSWLVGLLLEHDWSVRQTEAAVDAVRQLGEVPECLAGWLDPDSYKTKAAKEAAEDKDGKSPTAKSVASWVKAATEELDTLPESRDVWRIEDDVPRLEAMRLHEAFIERLHAIAGVPSAKRIRECAQRVHDEVIALDDAYERWQASRKDAEAKAKAEAAAAAELRQRKIRFSPVGINGDIRDVDLSEYGTFDAVITDPPYLLSNGGVTLRSGKETSVDKNFDDSAAEAIPPKVWVPIVNQHLRPGGVLIATCTLHILLELFDVAGELGLDVTREQAVWYKPGSPPLLSADRLQPDFEYIFIAHKPGGKTFFGYDEYRERWKGQPSRTFTIPQCSGAERLGWHDTQKPLELAEKLITLYVPKEGLMLDPFAGTGTFSAAAKQLGRRSIWVEKDAGFYARIETRMTDTRFAWER